MENQYSLKMKSKIQPHLYLKDTDDEQSMNPGQLRQMGKRVLLKRLDRAKSLMNIAD